MHLTTLYLPPTLHFSSTLCWWGTEFVTQIHRNFSYRTHFYSPTTTATYCFTTIFDICHFWYPSLESPTSTTSTSNGNLSCKRNKTWNPTPYDGDRDKLDNFLIEIKMYIMINNEIYNTPKKKIIFTPSYMKEETTMPWKQNFWATTNLNDTITPWTWNRFKDTLKTSFAPLDKPGEVLTWLVTESQEARTTDEYITDFKIDALQSELKEDLLLIEWFSTELNPRLAQKIRS